MPHRRPHPNRLTDCMRAGDLRAIDILAREHADRLLAVASRCCRRPVDAEDAVQQGLLEAAVHLESWEGRGDPLAWLSSLVAHSCYRLNRGRKNDPQLHTVDVESPCACADPEAQALQRERHGHVSRALQALARPDRLALLMALDGWTGPEIAAEFGCSPNAVRSRLKRARARLREDLRHTLDA